MRILGIETSCDDTGVAIYDEAQGLMAHALFRQIDIHNIYGGVVPELASRDHVRRLRPLVQDVLKSANTQPQALDAIAYTAGPGLQGALLSGAMFAHTLALAWGKPAVAVHHLEAHLLAPMLEEKKPTFPFVALLISGGHTLLAKVAGIGDYTILGQTLDDAAGEAFDKTAKIMGLPYPGGPELAAVAESGTPGKIHFSRPMCDRPGCDFSFSGLKTAARSAWEVSDKSAQSRADVAHAFETTVADTLFIKCRRALEATGYHRLVIAGGVAANKTIRNTLAKLDGELYYPRSEFCTDNGAMVAYCGYENFKRGHGLAHSPIAKARWPL